MRAPPPQGVGRQKMLTFLDPKETYLFFRAPYYDFLVDNYKSSKR